MLPTGDPGTGESRNLFRRYWPMMAVLAVVGLIAGVLIAGRGDDDTTGNDTVAASDTTVAPSEEGSGEPLPTGAIPFSIAEAGDLDVTFPEGCDEETGRIALPIVAREECYADVAVDDGYAPPPGVTEDTITVVVYIAAANDPILAAATGPINANDTPEQVEATYQGYVDIFNDYFQTYGRKVELKFLRGSGFTADEVAARADAVKAVNELNAFAVWGGPLLADTAWAEEIKANDRICFCGGGLEGGLDPLNYSGGPSGSQVRAQLVEYVSKKLNGKPATFAGDSFKTTDRVFGRIFLDAPGSTAQADAEALKASLSDEGVELKEQISYELDPTRLQEQAVSTISRLKSSGVTSVLLATDPITMSIFSQVATAQDYYPEWIIGDSLLLDTTAFARTFDQEQWKHAFGISALVARVAPEAYDANVLYRWAYDEDPPAYKLSPTIYPTPWQFFAAIQAAGPNLSNDTYREGVFSMPVDETKRVTWPHISFGSHGGWEDTSGVELPDYWGIDDLTEIWWDPTTSGSDEVYNEGKGVYRYVDGGARFRLGEWTDELKAFNPDGAIDAYDAVPPDEAPPDYPKPSA